MKVILWADEPNHAIAVREGLRQQKHVALIRDARFFAGVGDAEQAEAIAFINATKREEIVAAYRSEVYQARHGEVRVLDIDTGEFGEPLRVPELAVAEAPKEKGESDFLSARIDNMSDEALRTYARGVTGQDIPAEASREDIEALLRQPAGSALKAPPAPAEPPAPPVGAAEVRFDEPPATEAAAATEPPPGATDAAAPATPRRKARNQS